MGVMNTIIHGYDEPTPDVITLTVQKEDGNLISFTYSDRGKGIPEENLASIFKPFFTTKRDSGGSGLGLDIVHRIVTNNLQGSISCNSTLGEGTSFVVTLPMAQVDSNDLIIF